MSSTSHAIPKGRDSKITPAQQARLDELQDENGQPRIYTYPVQGKTVVGQFRRYVTQEDAEQIGHALYEFLAMVCGFIAEYGLIAPDGNFRIKWAEPAKLIAELANGGRAQRDFQRVERVYSDGMTDVEVLDAIDALAAEHRDACAAGCEGREFHCDLNVAITLLEPHHFVLVPPGWRLVAADQAQPSAQPPGSLAEQLVQMAAAHGLALIAPATVEPGGQVRLL
jgi:hypothetical protein